MFHRMPRAAFLVVVAGLSFAGYSSRADEPRRYEGYQIVRVNVKTPAELAALEQLGVEILNCTPGVGPMDVLASAEQLEAVRRIGWSPRVLQDDVQGMVNSQRAPLAVAGADPFTDFFLSYHPYDGFGGIVWYMNELVTRYPTLASMVNVGATLEGRSIWGVRITSSALATKPAAVYFGCEHAREWVACTVPAYLGSHLLENYGVDPDITDLVDNVEFFLIPVFNVDGYIYSWMTDRFWRKNRRNNGGGVYGVDINRNWGQGWGGPGSSSATSSETYRGTAPFSEPETQALRDFFIAHPNVRVQLDVHNYGQLILWPYGYTSALSPDHVLFQEIGSAMRSLIYGVHGLNYNIGPVYTGIYPASGVSVDWTYAQRGIVSYTYEARGGFTLPQNQIIPNNEELLPATLFLTSSDWVRLPMRLDFPNGLPTTVTAGVDSSILLRIIPQSESVEPGTASLHNRNDPSGPFVVTPLTPLGGVDYQAVLPATNCTSTPEFYFSVEGSGGTPMTNPRQTSVPQYYSVVVEFQPGSNTCEGIAGDYNGDNRIAENDFDAMGTCFTGPGGSIGPGCAILDFNGDGDVDCVDWAAFREAWMEPRVPPPLAQCSQLPSPVVNAEGPRYVAVTLAPSTTPGAVLLTNPNYPCWSKYVDFDPEPEMRGLGIGRLVDTPAYRRTLEWGTIHVADVGVLPGSLYWVQVDYGGGEYSVLASATTNLWGDLAAPSGTVNALDIVAIVDRFKSIPGSPPIEGCDLYPAIPDHRINALDVTVAVDALKGLRYPFPLPQGCP